jgi:hypothetical protein
MMICPETFYEMNLKGKTPEQIMTVIRSLKREIGRLKNIVERPDYAPKFHPTERVRISCSRDYLFRAQIALMEAGGTYTPSAAEQKAIRFDENIPYINKIVFSIGGYFDGYETKTYTIDGDKVHTYLEHSLNLKPSNFNDNDIEAIDKEEFFEQLENLHIGEWRRIYNLERFGMQILDGTQWDLEIYFSNGFRPIKIYGDNAYPYNFDQLLELFEIED